MPLSIVREAFWGSQWDTEDWYVLVLFVAILWSSGWVKTVATIHTYIYKYVNVSLMWWFSLFLQQWIKTQMCAKASDSHFASPWIAAWGQTAAQWEMVVNTVWCLLSGRWKWLTDLCQTTVVIWLFANWVKHFPTVLFKIIQVMAAALQHAVTV